MLTRVLVDEVSKSEYLCNILSFTKPPYHSAIPASTPKRSEMCNKTLEWHTMVVLCCGLLLHAADVRSTGVASSKISFVGHGVTMNVLPVHASPPTKSDAIHCN